MRQPILMSGVSGTLAALLLACNATPVTGTDPDGGIAIGDVEPVEQPISSEAGSIEDGARGLDAGSGPGDVAIQDVCIGENDAVVPDTGGGWEDAATQDAGTGEDARAPGGGDAGRFPAPCVTRHDFDVDGTTDRIDTCTFDDAGYMTACEIDLDADGTHEIRVAYSYDEQGHLLTEVQQDPGNMPVPPQCRAFEYDDAGRKIRENIDDLCDGVWDYYLFWLYDQQSRLETFSRDTNADGQMDEVVRYTYDERDLLVRADRDLGDDGRVDERWSYDYDDAGRVIRWIIDEGNDGSVDSFHRYEYTVDAAGNLTETWYADDDADGFADHRFIAITTSSGNPIYEAHGFGEDGPVDFQISFVYDDADNLLCYEVDYGADGIVDSRTVLDYECFKD